MASLDLLPPNATQFERDLAASSDFLKKTEGKVPLIRTAKRIDIPDDVVPWLIYEYGLGELLPYLPDPRVAIAEGVLWQRYRGTPAAIKTALGWINFNATLEESEAGTIRWAQWQLGLDQAPESLAFIGNVIGISRLSSPARSDLFRVYGGWYDYRRFWLDDTQLSSGSWLADHTGVYLQDDWPQLSFGREFKTDPVVQSTGIERTKEHIEGEVYVYEDRFILSQSEIDEFWHLLQESTFTISRLHFGLFTAVAWQVGPDRWDTPEATWQTQTTWGGFSTVPPYKFARAGIYLSDYSVLEETDTCFGAREEFEFGDGPFLLSEGNAATGESLLSDHIQRWEYAEINDRHERQTASVVAPYAGFIGQVDKQVDRLTSRLLRYEDAFWLDYGRLDEDKHFLLESSITHTVSSISNAYNQAGPDWSGGNWLDGSTWLSSMGSMVPALTFAVAGVYLSEGELLDDTDTAFSVEFNGQEITDRHERITGSSVVAYTTAAVAERQHGRLHQTTATGTGLVWQTWEDAAYGSPFQWNVDSTPDDWESQSSWAATDQWSDQTQDWQSESWINAVDVWNALALTVSTSHSTHT